jgi:choline dehydrogenase
VALRGLPRDFDEWVKLGCPDWSWENVLPFYKRLEDDRDFIDDQHGQGGPVVVTRPRRDEVHGLDVAFWQECLRRGVPDLPDLNCGSEAGVGPVPTNSVHGERVDMATAYLASARCRPNLEVRASTRVTRVVLDGRRAIGVEVLHDGRLTTVRARDVVLSAGAIGTPVILLRSGIGSALLCSALGVTPVVDLPGVGENLADHASVVIWALPKPGVCRPSSRWRDVAARLRGGLDDDVDLQVGLLNNVDSSAIPGFAGRLEGASVVGISVMLLRPRSRGRVFLDDPDPHGQPVIELALGTAAEDVERLAHGVRLAWSLLRSPGIANQLDSVQLWTDRTVRDDTLVRSGVRNIMNPGWHAAGSARMGPACDRMSVVDQQCRVYGVENLRVVDASVFPTIPSAPTNLTTIMLAERVASDSVRG